MNKTILIHIYIGNYNKEHGMRRWYQVPRLGDRICVKINDNIYSLKIKEIVWGITEASRETENCEVSILCEKVR